MGKYVTYPGLLLLQVVFLYPSKVEGSLQNDIEVRLGKINETTVLSRNRRYLVFPAGSSFQLVFDLAYPTLDHIGLYVFGNTAAMAWELPSTPAFLDKKFRKKEEPTTTTPLPHLEYPVEYKHDDWHPPFSLEDTHKIDYLPDWKDKISLKPMYGTIDRSPVSLYSNPFKSYVKNGYNSEDYILSNKYPTHYVADNGEGYRYWRDPSNFWTRRIFHDNRRNYERKFPSRIRTFENNANYFDRDLHHNIHRRSRRDLYTKLEELLSALIKDGKSCILKTICQVNKTPKGKGTLWEELLKTVFKVKPDDFHNNEDDYDHAANINHDCDKIYSECDGNVFSKVITTVMKR